MIKRKRKICKLCGKPEYLYSHGLCRRCWGMEQAKNNAASKRQGSIYRRSHPQEGYGTTQRKKSLKTSKIKPRSDKRKEQEAEYAKIKREILKEQKTCFFCGEAIKDKADVHHIYGRMEHRLTDKEGLMAAHRKCHRQYHDDPIESIPWFETYILRIKDNYPDLQRKEMRKIWKSDKK